MYRYQLVFALPIKKARSPYDMFLYKKILQSS